jgi:hypothetical protein
MDSIALDFLRDSILGDPKRLAADYAHVDEAELKRALRAYHDAVTFRSRDVALAAVAGLDRPNLTAVLGATQEDEDSITRNLLLLERSIINDPLYEEASHALHNYHWRSGPVPVERKRVAARVRFIVGLTDAIEAGLVRLLPLSIFDLFTHFGRPPEAPPLWTTVPPDVVDWLLRHADCRLRQPESTGGPYMLEYGDTSTSPAPSQAFAVWFNGDEEPRDVDRLRAGQAFVGLNPPFSHKVQHQATALAMRVVGEFNQACALGVSYMPRSALTAELLTKLDGTLPPLGPPPPEPPQPPFPLPSLLATLAEPPEPPPQVRVPSRQVRRALERLAARKRTTNAPSGSSDTQPRKVAPPPPPPLGALAEFDIPVLRGISLSQLVEVRKAAPAAFDRFRITFSNQLRRVQEAAEDEERASRAGEMAEALQDDLHAVQLQQQSIAKRIAFSGTAIAAMPLLTYIAGGSTPSFALTAGAPVVEFLRALNDMQTAFREHPAYFLWRLKRRR